MKIVLPEKVTYIIDTLTQHGFEAYAVGGCVRDTMLGRIPMDWDITTSAKPEQVKELFRHTISFFSSVTLYGSSGCSSSFFPSFSHSA